MKLLCTSEVHPSEEKVTPPRFDFCHKNCKTGALITALIIAFPCVVHATPFTPLDWQQTVPSGPLAGQKKFLNWSQDTNQNFIDDEIDEISDTVTPPVDINVDLNRCLTSSEIEAKFSDFGIIQHV